MSIGDMRAMLLRGGDFRDKISDALEHTLNYHSIDAKIGVADYTLASILLPELIKHLRGETDVQVVERMTPEERLLIGKQSGDSK